MKSSDRRKICAACDADEHQHCYDAIEPHTCECGCCGPWGGNHHEAIADVLAAEVEECES